MARKEIFMARLLMFILLSLLSLSVGRTEDAMQKQTSLAAATSARASIPKFYAYCIGLGVPGVTPCPLTEQVKLLREIGYDGIALELDNNMDSNLRIIDDAGLQLYMVWISIRLTPGKDAVITPGLSNAIVKLKGRPTTICVLFDGIKPGNPQGIPPAVDILRKLGNLADAAGIRISIYNHVGNWTESLPFVIEVVKKTNHPRVGYNFNLCHWLKVNGGQDYRPLLRENADKLFVVTINGASVRAKEWTNGLIRPLDEGDFNNRQLLATLRAIGYRGPIGLMCYGVPDDDRNHLTRSMKVWRNFIQADNSGQ